MSLPIMPMSNPISTAPTVAFCNDYFGTPSTLTNLGADNPNRVVVLCASSGSIGTNTISIGGVSQTVYYPQANGTVLTTGSGSYTQFAIARVPTGLTVSASIANGTTCMWYTITGLNDLVPRSGTNDSGNPASGVVVMEEGSAIIANLYASNDNNSFTWSSGMIRTVNNTSLGPSRGASSAYRANTPAGSYTLTCSMGSGTMYMGALVLR
jgi:hypothetical protein